MKVAIITFLVFAAILSGLGGYSYVLSTKDTDAETAGGRTLVAGLLSVASAACFLIAAVLAFIMVVL